MLICLKNRQSFDLSWAQSHSPLWAPPEVTDCYIGFKAYLCCDELLSDSLRALETKALIFSISAKFCSSAGLLGLRTAPISRCNSEGRYLNANQYNSWIDKTEKNNGSDYWLVVFTTAISVCFAVSYWQNKWSFDYVFFNVYENQRIRIRDRDKRQLFCAECQVICDIPKKEEKRDREWKQRVKTFVTFP